MTKRTAVVTGGTKGIGLALSHRLAELGYHVVALYRADKASADALAGELGERATVLQVDVADPEQVSAFSEQLLLLHGAPSVLVNNAGRNIDGPFLTMPDDAWQQVVATNLSAPFYLTRALAPAMLTLEAGASIVNLGATTALEPRLNGVNYCASKAGLLHLTKCLALELAPRIRVNCLIPGLINTEEMRTRYRTDDPDAYAARMTEIPQRRIGEPEEIANALEFLVSEGGRYITGQKLIVDGGWFMW